MDYKIFILNFTISTLIIVLSFYYYFKFGDDKVDEYLIIIAFLFSIVAYIKFNIKKFIK